MTSPVAAVEKVRIGVRLTYGPMNQPWQRWASMVLTRLEELGAQPVTMKLYPSVDGGVSTQEEISIARNNFAAVFKANPEKGAFKVIIGWWWPDTVGAIQAMREQGRDKEGIGVFNTYVSKTLLTEMARPDTPLVGCADLDCIKLGTMIGDFLYGVATNPTFPKTEVGWGPVQWIPKEKAKETLEWLTKDDERTQKKLKQYGG
jgi:ABC-type sugar transport system substrate-binding protein